MKSEFPIIDKFDPRQCIAGKLLRCDRIVAKIFRQYLQPFNITNSQVSILFMASKMSPMTQTEIAKKQRLEKSSVSRNMKRLLEHGYLTKENANISITYKGKKLLEQIIPEWEKAMKEIKSALQTEGEEALNVVVRQLAKI